MTHVLVVDDEPGIRETFQEILEEEGYNVATAADFFEAESLLAERSFDVVVTDIILPRVSGLALLQRVREIDEDIPVIMVTGEPDVSTAAEAVRHGAYEYVAKPVTLEALLHIVGRAAEKKRLLDEKRRLEAANQDYQADLEKRVAVRTAELEQRNRELAALIEIGHDISATLDLTKVLKRVTRRAAQVCGSHRCTILLLAKDGETLTPIMSQFSDGHLDRDLWRLFRDVRYPVPVSQVPEAQQVIREQRPLFVADALASSLPRHLIETFGVKSVLLVPLISKERVTGLMVLDRVEEGAASPREFTTDQIDLATAIGAQTAIAIENARLFEETREHVVHLERATRDMELVHQVSQVVNSSLDLARILETTVEQMVVVFEADHSGIMLFDQAYTYGQVVAEYPSTGATAERFPVQGYLAAERVIADRESLVIEDVWHDPLMATVREAMHRLDIRSMLIVPLIVKEEVVGSIGLDAVGRQRCFSAEEVALAQTIANQVAIAIENARLFEEAQRRWQEAETLYRAAQALATTLDLHQVFECILSELQQVVPYDSASVQLLRDKRLEIIGGHGFPNLDELLGVTFDLSESNPNREVMRRRAPFIVDDAPAVYPEFRKEPHAAAGIRAYLGVPLLFGDRLIGMLALDKREPGFYTAEHARLASAFAAQAAIAIENAHLFDETKRRAEEMTALYHTSLEIGTPTDLPDLLWAICDRAAKLLDVDKGGLYLYDEAREELELVLSYKLERDFTGTRFKLGEGVAGRIAQTGQSLIVNDYSRWEGRAPVYGEEPLAAVIGAPLRWQERIIGAITLSEETKQRTFTPGDERLLALFAQQAAAVIENARLYEDARRHVEELTALHTIDIAIASTLNLDQVLQRVYEQVGALMDDVAFYIALYNEERDELYVPIIVDQGERLPPQTLKVEEASGLTGWVIRTREPLWIGDLERERDTLPVKAITLGTPIRSLMVLPLVVRDKVVGVISAQSYKPHVFDEGHRRLFAGIASQVAIAVENARLFEETDRRLNEVSFLHDVALASVATLDFDEVLRHTVELVRSELQLDVFGFLLVDEEAGVARLHPTFLGIPDEATDFSTPLGEGITGWVAQTGQPLLVPDVGKEPRYQEVIPGVRSEICVPLKIGDKVIGVIDVESKELDAFSGDDVRFFSTLAAQLGVVLENTRLYKKATHRLAEATLTQEVMLAIASTLDFDLVLERAVKALHRALKIDRLGFLLPGERDDVLSPHPSLVGFTGEDFQVPIESSLTGRAYRTGQPVLMRDAEQESAQFPDIRSALAVPVWVGGRIVAVFHAESRQQGVFGEDELRLFTTIAGQLGVALENARLYQRLEVQAAKLSQAYEELQEINRLRTELVQNVGHELRTPLGLVKGYVELLLGGDLGDLLGAQRDALEVVRARTDTLERLIHNLTVLQAVPRNALTLVPVSVGEALRYALAEFRPVVERADVVFQDELPAELPLVLGDQKRLKLVFDHLVDNAIKFSPDGGTVTVRAWADREMVYVSIADEGIGIPFEHQDRIFERFYQVNGSVSRRFGGMGVGLALVWEIVEAHYGTVSVKSEPGKGSIFIVALPRAEK